MSTPTPPEQRHYIGITALGRVHMTIGPGAPDTFTTSPTAPLQMEDGRQLFPVSADVAAEWDRDDGDEDEPLCGHSPPALWPSAAVVVCAEVAGHRMPHRDKQGATWAPITSADQPETEGPAYVSVPRVQLDEWRRLVVDFAELDGVARSAAGQMLYTAGSIAYWSQQPAGPRVGR